MSHINNKRIAKNTIILYFRMIITLAISFLTTRITLKALGVEDLGIYNIVGGVIVLFDFVSSGLTNSTLRYLNFAIGKNDEELIKRYFSQSLLIHIFFAVFLVVVGETIGLWFMETQLTIPENRKDVAFWVYQCSIISVVFSILRIPYNSAIIAYEKMTSFAYLGILESILRLSIAYIILFNSNVDKLLLYSILMLLLPFLIFISYYKYCTIRFYTCRYKFIWDKRIIKEMILYIGYNAYGCISWALGIKSIDFLLNIFFNPIVNGARALALTLNGAIQRFNDSIYTAAKPQLIKSYAKEEYYYSMNLSNRVTKYSFYLLLLLGFPVILNTEYILSIWLGEVPEYTVMFTRLAIIESWVTSLPETAKTIIQASGKIKGVEVYARTITLLSFPVSYLILKFLFIDVYLPIYISIITRIFYWAYCINYLRKIIPFKIKDYLKIIVIPISIVVLLFCLISYGINFYNIENDFLRLIVTSTTIAILGLLAIYYCGITTSDRTLISNFIKKKVKIYR